VTHDASAAAMAQRQLKLELGKLIERDGAPAAAVVFRAS
jgi:ABC-type lipoprotein export system ATPase subunit